MLKKDCAAWILSVWNCLLSCVFSQIPLHVGKSVRTTFKIKLQQTRRKAWLCTKLNISRMSTVRLFAIATAKYSSASRISGILWEFSIVSLVTTPHFNISISLRFFRATQKFRFVLRNVALWLRDERTWHYLVEIKFSFRMTLHSLAQKKWRKEWSEWIRRLLI